MKVKSFKKTLLLLVALACPCTGNIEACSTTIFSGPATWNGAPMLWKNRDTDSLSNKVIFVNEKPYNYLALINAQDTSGRWAYAGLNIAGFAIINSVAYNLPEESGEMKDLEGAIMADALRTCRTADDFEKYLRKNLGENLGSWANFGVIDADGQAMIFEVHNHGIQKFDAATTPEKYLVNTNFARSGKPDQGAGYLRFERISELLRPVQPGRITPDFVLTELSRDLGHILLNHPTQKEWQSLSGKSPCWLYTNDCINRGSTSATALFCGSKSGSGEPATFWVSLGEPVCSIALPLWVESGMPPAACQEGDNAALYLESKRLKNLLRPLKERGKSEYLDVTRLDNREKTGFLPQLQQTQATILAQTKEFLKTAHSPAEMSLFQQQMADLALATLKQVK